MATHTLVDPASKAYKTVNPATGEVVRKFATLSDDEAQALLARAHAAYLNWRKAPVAERAQLFARFADLVKRNAGELARLTTLEMGKPSPSLRGGRRHSPCDVPLLRGARRGTARRRGGPDSRLHPGDHAT